MLRLDVGRDSYVSQNQPSSGNRGSKAANDGIFWVSAVDFCKVFTTVFICGTPPSAPGQVIVKEGSWTATTAGGTWHDKTWLRNPQFALSLQADAEVMISLRRLPDEPFRRPRMRVQRHFNEVRVTETESCTVAPAIGFALVKHEFNAGATRFVRLAQPACW